MLYTIGVILIILWLFGLVGVFALGKFIHLLLLAAIVMFLIRIIQGKNPLS